MLVALSGSVALAAAFMVLSAGAASAAPNTLRVGCGHDSYPTITAAVNAAPSWATVTVCPGTYAEDVVVTKPVSIIGLGHPVINASGLSNGVDVQASGTEIQGLTVENAVGEGILVGFAPGSAPAPAVSDVTIRDNTVADNDQGTPATTSYWECLPTQGVPGDCGEGIHLLHATDSRVVGNTVAGNSGGILLSDDSGPTYGNLIAYNDVSGNLYDCGITIAGHAPQVFGGVYGNSILDNQVTNNGVDGQGAGVLLATGVPGGLLGAGSAGGAVYNNLVEGNYLAGNGLAGVTVHSHAPAEDLNGNTITGNVIGTNNLTPDEDFAGFSLYDGQSTGVIVETASPIQITIARNLIAQDTDGVFLGQVLSVTPPGTISASGLASNRFVHVANDVVTCPTAGSVCLP
jgi:parallel beta-helix repeat protein